MWQPRKKDIKHYPHFDAPLAAKEVARIANDPVEVAQNAFFPLLKFTRQWKPYRDARNRAPKIRELRYASRRDAAIYARYRAILSERYEAFLAASGLSGHVVGYRSIPDEITTGSKTNIHFARDAFLFVQRTKTCTVVVADISSFFECMDHALLRTRWASMLNVGRLPDDHYAVYKNVCQYRVIDQTALYEALGFVEMKDGHPIYAHSRSDMPKQLAPLDLIRSLLKNKKVKIHKNVDAFGIPQGLPISDVLANIYMKEFDASVSEWCTERSGFYQRYSDDIICIIPDNISSDTEIMKFLQSQISLNGSELKIKKEKVNSADYQLSLDGNRTCRPGMGSSKNGVEYLGFRYDGNRVYLRDKTLSNLNRKFKSRARGMSRAHVARYQGKSPDWLRDNFDVRAAVANFLRRERFGEVKGPKDWTFWTYTRKAEQVLEPLQPRIFQQLAGFKKRATPTLNSYLATAIASI